MLKKLFFLVLCLSLQVTALAKKTDPASDFTVVPKRSNAVELSIPKKFSKIQFYATLEMPSSEESVTMFQITFGQKWDKAFTIELNDQNCTGAYAVELAQYDQKTFTTDYTDFKNRIPWPEVVDVTITREKVKKGFDYTVSVNGESHSFFHKQRIRELTMRSFLGEVAVTGFNIAK